MTGTLLLSVWPPQEYKQSEHTWENIRQHLQGYMADNLTLDIKQAKIIGMQHASLRLLPGTDTLQGIAEGLKSLSPLEWIRGIRGGLIKTLHMLCCFTIILCLVFRGTWKSSENWWRKKSWDRHNFCYKNRKGEMQGLRVSHLSLWLSHEKNTMGKE